MFRARETDNYGLRPGMRILLAIIVAFAAWACDHGVVHLSRYPDGSVRERWVEKAAQGGASIREGEYRSFRPDGSREMIVPYKGGKRDGHARAWDFRKRLSAERFWSRGFLLREIIYDSAERARIERRFEIRTAMAKAAGPAGDTLAAGETCAWTIGDGRPSVRDGLCEMRYPDGKPLAESHYRAGRLDGPVKAWYADGAPWIEGAYAGGLPVGRWKAHTPGGGLSWSGTYAQGERDGLWEEWFPGGSRKSAAAWRRGRPEGGYQEWYPAGGLRLRGACAGGRRQGPEEAWYPDGGRLYTAAYADGLLDGEFSQWHPGGKLRLRCRFAHGSKQGLSRVWYRSGRLQEQAYYRNGRLDGPYRTFTPEGLPMAMREYRNGSMAFDAKARELLDLLGAARYRVPAGILGFYWGMGNKECRANLGLYQAARVRADTGAVTADIVAFPDRKPTLAHIRLDFNAQGELWGIKLELRQETAADFFALCENLEVEMGAGLGTTSLRRADAQGGGGPAPYAMLRRRDWGRFTVESAAGGIKRELAVLSAEGFSPGDKGWFRFSLENNLYREYVDPGSATISPPRWEGETLFAGG
jgi:antitoxin component YwqK of YwqJK toxin-antitoxin module